MIFNLFAQRGHEQNETTVNKHPKKHFCNEHHDTSPDEAAARFDRLSNEHKEKFGINSNDKLETVTRILDECCGDELFSSLGMGIKSHFTYKDFITGNVNVLLFIETFTNAVAVQMQQKKSEELMNYAPLYRQENRTGSFRPHAIFSHSVVLVPE